MISLRFPKASVVEQRLAALGEAPLSYPASGMTRGEAPPGYRVDRNATSLGRGSDCFERACVTLRKWGHYRMSWVHAFPQGEPAPDVLIAVVARGGPFWWTNVCRVVYMVEEPTSFGYAYGTLDDHAERGEELFLVEHDPDTDEVTYRILAFSRPRHPLVWLGLPLARAAQRRFAADSMQAMREAVGKTR